MAPSAPGRILNISTTCARRAKQVPFSVRQLPISAGHPSNDSQAGGFQNDQKVPYFRDRGNCYMNMLQTYFPENVDWVTVCDILPHRLEKSLSDLWLCPPDRLLDQGRSGKHAGYCHCGDTGLLSLRHRHVRHALRMPCFDGEAAGSLPQQVSGSGRKPKADR